MIWLAIGIAVLWSWLALHDLRAVLALPELPPLPAVPETREITVVMAVRDDGDEVEAAVRHWLRQRHVDLHLVVVDDRSRDDTASVLATLAADEPRLTVRRVLELPPDWLGKSHALHLGADAATTRWLLFTDGDARLSDDALVRAIDAAEHTGAQHVCLLPNHRNTTFFGRVSLIAFQLSIQRRVRAVNAERQRGFLGTGAFNLVRTDAYRDVGGHEPLRLEIVDDVWLGYLLHKQGYRSRVWAAHRDFFIDWGASPRAFVRVVEKNMFAVLRYQTAAAIAVVTISLALVFGSLLAPWLLGAIGWLPFAAYLSTGVAGALLAPRLGWNPIAGLLSPLARILLPVALLNSMVKTLWRGGVVWRDTRYPLAMLRRGQLPLR